jgi:hypothetical protein
MKERNLAFHNPNDGEWSVWTKGGYHFISDQQFEEAAEAFKQKLAKSHGIDQRDIVLRQEYESDDDDDSLDMENDEDLQAPPTRMTRKGKGVKESTLCEKEQPVQKKVTFVEQKSPEVETPPQPKAEPVVVETVVIKTPEVPTLVAETTVLGLTPEVPKKVLPETPNPLEGLEKKLLEAITALEKKVEERQKVFLQGLKSSIQAQSKDENGSKKTRTRGKNKSTSDQEPSKKTKASSAGEKKSN